MCRENNAHWVSVICHRWKLAAQLRVGAASCWTAQTLMLTMTPAPMQLEIHLVEALCSLRVYPLSQVEAGSAAEGKQLVLPGCAEIILTMSPEHYAHWVFVICHRWKLAVQLRVGAASCQAVQKSS